MNLEYQSTESALQVWADICAEYCSGDFLGIQSSQGLYEYLLSCSAGFTKLRDRTCLAIGGTVTGDGLQPAGHMPEWLRALIECIQKQILELLDLSQPNHALINVYEPGEGILAHEDGPAYSPYAVILSLGSACMFDFVEKSETRRMLGQVYLPVGSVLVFRDEAYKSVLHQFAARRFDQIPSHAKFDPARLGSAKLVGSSLERGKRISITLRHVRVRQEL